MNTDMLREAFTTTRALVAGVSHDQLDDPTPCQSWKVRDLLNHIVSGSQWYAVTMDSGQWSPPDGHDFAAGDFVVEYDRGISDTMAAFGAPGALEKLVTLPFGTFPGEMFLGLATTDTFVHGWDLAKATGHATDLDPALAEQLLERARQVMTPERRGPDGQAPFGAERPATAGAGTADQLAAFLGREV
jgi:uncharacterized protein (TIGR03086 family)